MTDSTPPCTPRPSLPTHTKPFLNTQQHATATAKQLLGACKDIAYKVFLVTAKQYGGFLGLYSSDGTCVGGLTVRGWLYL